MVVHIGKLIVEIVHIWFLHLEFVLLTLTIQRPMLGLEARVIIRTMRCCALRLMLVIA
jgi:hypothetical protein